MNSLVQPREILESGQCRTPMFIAMQALLHGLVRVIIGGARMT